MRKAPRFPTGEVVRIAVLVVLLVGIIVLKSRCGRAASSLIHAFDVTAPSDGGHD